MQYFVNHRVELAVTEAFFIPVFKKVDDLPVKLIIWNSGKKELQKSAQALGIDCYLPSKTIGSRFVLHLVKGFKDLMASWPAHIKQ